MNGERGKRATRARMRDVVVDALAERVKVVTVEQRAEEVEVQPAEERPFSFVFITIRLPEGITDQERLATQEWVQLRLIDLDGAKDGLVHVPRYI
ncbi:MAG TPA: hypothetical protein VFY58_02260 [Nocardioides sp.]|nr:hypothetical protein [Nocardioides sp.]